MERVHLPYRRPQRQFLLDDWHRGDGFLYELLIVPSLMEHTDNQFGYPPVALSLLLYKSVQHARFMKSR